MFEGKKGLILGVANDRSIAWAVANTIIEQGGQCGFSHLPDRDDDEKKRNRKRVEKAIAKFGDNYEPAFLEPLDVQNDDQITAIMQAAADKFGKIDFLLHAIAFAHPDDLGGDTIDTSREGFKMAMDSSAYSLIAVCRAARDLFSDNASVLCMSYFGGEKIVPGYNVMGICKSALDASMRYLAFDLGPDGVRVNALSAGPVKTISGVGAGVGKMMEMYAHVAPMSRNISVDEVGQSGAFLLSDMASGITGELMHVDCGYNAMGSPGRLTNLLAKG